MLNITTQMAFDAFLIVLENVRNDLKQKNLSKSSSYRHCVNSIRELKKFQSLASSSEFRQPCLF